MLMIMVKVVVMTCHGQESRQDRDRVGGSRKRGASRVRSRETRPFRRSLVGVRDRVTVGGWVGLSLSEKWHSHIVMRSPLLVATSAVMRPQQMSCPPQDHVGGDTVATTVVWGGDT